MLFLALDLIGRKINSFCQKNWFLKLNNDVGILKHSFSV